MSRESDNPTGRGGEVRPTGATDAARAAMSAASQTQFLEVLTRDEAERRFQTALRLEPVGAEAVSLYAARGRVLAETVRASVDVPGFDRANVDGFAVRSADVSTAAEETPVRLRLNDELLSPGVRPTVEVLPGTATTIATGGMFPRGADAVVMVEQTDVVIPPGARER
ncbi:MAG: hypothetical protein R3B90_05915 [Planctomycetaceae bacterium]